VQVNLVLRKLSILRLLCLQDEGFLKVTLSAKYRRQGVILVFTLKKLQSLTAAGTGLLLHRQALHVQPLIYHNLLLVVISFYFIFTL